MSRFRIGQDVVCLENFNCEIMTEPLIKGKTYTVTGTGTCCVKACISVGIKVTLHIAESAGCGKCNRIMPEGEELHFPDQLFAPLEEIEKEESLVIQEFYKILQPVEEPLHV